MEEVESEGIKIAGFICRNFNVDYSRPMADRSIQDYFESEGLVAITDLDTRAIVQHIRSKGAMKRRWAQHWPMICVRRP